MHLNIDALAEEQGCFGEMAEPVAMPSSLDIGNGIEPCSVSCSPAFVGRRCFLQLVMLVSTMKVRVPAETINHMRYMADAVDVA